LLCDHPQLPVPVRRHHLGLDPPAPGAAGGLGRLGAAVGAARGPGGRRHPGRAERAGQLPVAALVPVLGADLDHPGRVRDLGGHRPRRRAAGHRGLIGGAGWPAGATTTASFACATGRMGAAPGWWCGGLCGSVAVRGAATAGLWLVGATVGDWLAGPAALLAAVLTGWRLRFRLSLE